MHACRVERSERAAALSHGAVELRAEGLVRAYSGRRVVDGVSLLVTPGHPVGLLGANGAGKTTTLRLLSGYLPPTAGRVTICGLDLAREPRRAKALVGYVAENVPLYPEMRVDELLAHRAALRGLGARRRARIDAVVEVCDLGDVRYRLVGQLSKGFRQRVGLADALLAEPAVLLLDEPTDGLDPNQRRELLGKVVELAHASAVLLSSHVLDEVQAICGRVLILAAGRVIAEGPPDELLAPGFLVEARGDATAIAAALGNVPGVHQVKIEQALLAKPGVVRLRVHCNIPTGGEIAEALTRAVIGPGAGELRELSPTGLGEAFARLTCASSSEGAL